jgi:putative colanic acid biosynthesis acetyltransferase WcaF
MIPSRSTTPARNISPYTLRENIARVVWACTQATLFALSPKPLYPWRSWLLARFGAKVGKNVRLRPSVKIEIPWNLTIEDDVIVGDHAILYALGEITIGARSLVSQYTHLCAGTHDHTKSSYPLLRTPIKIGNDCWLAADVFVGPGAVIGDGVLVGARSTVFGTLPPWMIAVGYPARPIKPREYTNDCKNLGA